VTWDLLLMNGVSQRATSVVCSVPSGWPFRETVTVVSHRPAMKTSPVPRYRPPPTGSTFTLLRIAGMLIVGMAGMNNCTTTSCTDCCQRLRPCQADIAHVADVENAHARSHRIVLGHDPAHGRVFDRHLPAIKFDHFGAHLAMDRIERGLADGWRSRLDCGQ